MLKSSTPTRSTSVSSSKTTASITSLSNPNSEPELLDFKKLEQTLHKFNSYKKNSTTKTNILRLVILPYLRSNTVPWTLIQQPQQPNKSGTTSPDIYSDKYVRLSTSVFLKWWSSLLASAKDIQHTASLDKNCYLESISRIISRFEWLYIEKKFAYQDILAKHNELLLETFEFAISRLSVKNISLSINAFIGKVFAYSFLKLPDISKGLLFLLTSKVKNHEDLYNMVVLNKNPNNRFTPTITNLTKYSNILNENSNKFPPHLISLIRSAIRPRQTKFKVEKAFLNSMYPPSEKIKGINDTKGLWCFRWASLDQIDLFCSFMRHYLTLSSFYLKRTNSRGSSVLEVFGLPGFSYLLTHLFEILDFQIMQQTRQSQQNVSPVSGILDLQVDKIMRLLRDFLSVCRHEFEPGLRVGVIKNIDNVLKLLIYRTSIFEISKIDTIFEFWIKFVKSQKEVFPLESDDIDWEFWLNIQVKLLDSSNINIELRSISVLFQVWDYLPADIYLANHSNTYSWVVDANENLKFNLGYYLINRTNWNRFFGHYLALVRGYYIRFLVWRLIGIGSLNVTKPLNFRDSIQLKRMSQLIYVNLSRSYKMCKDMEIKPVDPILNKKFVILPINAYSEDSNKKETIRTHPYEILDDAVYSCANLSLSAVAATSSPSSSLSLSSTSSPAQRLSTKFASTWVSKFFKKKDGEAEEEAGAEAVDVSKQTASTTSADGRASDKGGATLQLMSSPFLSLTSEEDSKRYNELLKTPPKIFGSSPAVSLSSKSSSPSLLSTITSLSSPQSSMSSFEFIDQSTNSATSTSHHTFLPPELNLKPKELSKSYFKFQLVNNDLKIQNTFTNLNRINQVKFVKPEGLVTVEQPSLPSLDKYSVQPDLTSYSDDDDDDDDDDKDESGNDLSKGFEGIQLNFETDFMKDLQLELGLKSLSDNSPPSSPLSITHKLLEASSDSEKLNDMEAGNKINLSNGLHEYSAIVNEFEIFIQAKLNEKNKKDIANANNSTTSVDDGRSKLFDMVPVLIPEAPEKFNGL
ncbi:hypothetical protein CANARDRAFT_29203 [[Candida] arabinofermentans NRRL YB-2248]|uniref:Uncharacterized protein n=1 Tax=[Candida] arabinofermentans NRRL YB-2248 TaxID=983967 RepID=A0A1E4SXZ8_9ASCO|nr:hypothetical protein CANARDRAFT_29203 [[Candida] arabinofermentans NRRL YB-2248]